MENTLNELLAQSKSLIDHAEKFHKKPLHIIYFMDPICSSCWSIESHVRKLLFEYGEHISIEFKMGGLLEKLSDGEEKQKMVTEIANHWNQMDQNSAMPIDGDLWLEDPIASSYPPSIAFKSALLQDPIKALNLLRNLRELVFLFKKNITRWDILETAIIAAGLDPVQLKNDMEGTGKKMFEEDLTMAKLFSINWFPTMFFITSKGLEEMVSGPRTYAFYENLIKRLQPSIQKSAKSKGIESLFDQFESFTTGELAEIADISKEECLEHLHQLTKEDKVQMMESKNGVLWKRKGLKN